MGQLAADCAPVIAVEEADEPHAGIVGPGNDLLFIHGVFVPPAVSQTSCWERTKKFFVLPVEYML
jgi:hypothetical protein